MKTLYLIGGTMGVGKTAVCRELKRLLPNAVMLDGDWCWDADPFIVTDETKAMVLDNIRHLLNSFIRCSVYENIVFCWVMHERAIIDDILSGLELTACGVRVVSLTAAGETLTERITRDVENGVRTIDVLERSLARISMYDDIDSVKIKTDGKTVVEVAREIVEGGHDALS